MNQSSEAILEIAAALGEAIARAHLAGNLEPDEGENLARLDAEREKGDAA